MSGWLNRGALLVPPWLRELWAGLTLVWKLVISLGALAAAVVAIAGAVELIRDEDPAPQKLAGDITTLELAQRQTLGDYCRETFTGEERRTCLSQPFVEELGFVFYVRVHLVGYQGPCCNLRYTLLDEDLNELEGFDGVSAVNNVTPEGNDDKGGWRVWVGQPDASQFTARFDLRKSNGADLDSRDVSVVV